MKFRPQRELLDESMAEAEELDMDSLTKKMVERFGPGEVRIEPYGYDKRIGWNTHIVLHEGRAVGFTDGP
jgi:hypothetical protein